MKRRNSLLLLALILFASSMAFRDWQNSQKNKPSEALNDQSFVQLAQAHVETESEDIQLPVQPYRLTPAQKRSATQCVQKELRSDANVTKELEVEKFCDCMELFDEKPYAKLNEEQKGAMFLRYSQGCDARHTISSEIGS